MLSEDTKREVLSILKDSRFAYILDMNRSDMGDGFTLKPFSEMTDDEILDEYECSYRVHPDDDELYDRMMAEMSAHKMLTAAPEVTIGDVEYMTRQEANRLIVKILADQVEKQPDNQRLWIINANIYVIIGYKCKHSYHMQTLRNQLNA